jgi:DNA-3-methyladenine glycosylase II
MPHKKHLFKDKKLRLAMKKEPGIVLEKKQHIHLVLCASIISQQLSTKAAATIHGRFRGLFSEKNPKPQDILKIPFETLRSIGLSQAKATYVRNVCAFFIEEKINDQKLHQMHRDEVIATLTKIKGVGRWTVEMLLMFGLGDEDVFSAGDLALQQSMVKLYDLGHLDKKSLMSELMRISENWKPYRTHACLYLWHWSDQD